MKWFAITNREKSGSKFGNEPEKHGKVHFLRNVTEAFPKRDKDLKLKYVGASDDSTSINKFVNEVKVELKLLSEKLEAKGIDRRPSLVIYTHGYNNDYEDSVEEYCELRRNFHSSVGADEFETQCLPILFTWPSAGKTLAYLEDRDDARASYPAVSNMVNILYEVTSSLELCISNVCVIAHSMGNYVFREALAALTGSGRSPAGTFIDQFLMIGADIGNTSLEPEGKGFGITRFSNRVSVYFTPADSTLGKSNRKNGRPRLGRTLSSKYLETPDNVLFCDCREFANDEKLSELFEQPPSVHSCYRSIPQILQDMFQTLHGVDRTIIPGRKEVVMNKHYRLQAGQ